jgi:hypothetical protein
MINMKIVSHFLRYLHKEKDPDKLWKVQARINPAYESMILKVESKVLLNLDKAFEQHKCSYCNRRCYAIGNYDEPNPAYGAVVNERKALICPQCKRIICSGCSMASFFSKHNPEQNFCPHCRTHLSDCTHFQDIIIHN